MNNMEVLTIFLHNAEIGSITRLPGDRHLFTFNQAYIDNENRPTLSLSFKNIYGDLNTSIKPTQTRLPTFFSNLLPEGMFRDYVAKQAGVKQEREFSLLWVLGHDLPGAVKALPIDHEHLPNKTTEYSIKNHNHATITNLFHFSLAGIQLKFSAIKNNNRGFTIPANGMGGSWIIKLPDRRYPHVPENEFAMMELARAIGIETPETMLVPLAHIHGLPDELCHYGDHAFAIKRFDRKADGTLIHIEDFAQVFNVYADKKYGIASYRNIAEILRDEVGEMAIIEFIRRLIFTILIGNGDMHLKNWSLIYPDNRTPALAPAYDFVSTIPYIQNDTLALNLGGEKNFNRIDRKTFSRFAAKTALSEKLVLDIIDETLDQFTQNWNNVSDYGLDKNFKQIIDSHLKTLPLY